MGCMEASSELKALRCLQQEAPRELRWAYLQALLEMHFPPRGLQTALLSGLLGLQATLAKDLAAGSPFFLPFLHKMQFTIAKLPVWR